MLCENLRRTVSASFVPRRAFFWPFKLTPKPLQNSSTSSDARARASFDVVKPWLFQDPSPWTNISVVPASISKPEYALSGRTGPPKKQTNLECGTRLSGIRRACKLAKQTLRHVEKYVKPGTSTNELDRRAFDHIIANDAYPSPLAYHGFPRSICTSVNNVACHGIPDTRRLMEGDVVNVDVTIDPAAQRLLDTTRKALDEAIAVCKHGVHMARIGETIEAITDAAEYEIIPNFVGHGIGEEFHMHPDVVHCGNLDKTVMQKGWVFTIEPIVSEGSGQITFLEDGWTAVSVDNSRSAQFEETILIHEDRAEVLTEMTGTVDRLAQNGSKMTSGSKPAPYPSSTYSRSISKLFPRGSPRTRQDFLVPWTVRGAEGLE